MDKFEKQAAIRRLNSQARAAERLVLADARTYEEVDLLLQAMEAFSAGELALIWRGTKGGGCKYPPAVRSVFDLKISGVAIPEEDRRTLTELGVRYLGELFYVQFDKYRRDGFERGERIMALVSQQYGVPTGADPLRRGWKPRYWANAAFKAELNVLILERCPTPPAPDFKRYVDLGFFGRDRVGMSDYDRRGIARNCHRNGTSHYLGQIIASNRDGKKSVGDLDWAAYALRACRSSLWAGAILPDDWKPPEFRTTEAWQKEFIAIGVERRAIEEFEALEREQASAKPATVLDLVIDEFNVTFDTVGRLRVIGVKTVRQLVGMREDELTRNKGFGPKSKLQLKEELAKFGLSLGMTEAAIEEYAARNAAKE